MLKYEILGVLVLLLWLDSPLIQTPRAVLFIIQSIKTVVAGRWDPITQVKKTERLTGKEKIIKWLPSHSSNHCLLPLHLCPLPPGGLSFLKFLIYELFLFPLIFPWNLARVG
jgi:hypothetical protein